MCLAALWQAGPPRLLRHDVAAPRRGPARGRPAPRTRPRLTCGLRRLLCKCGVLRLRSACRENAPPSRRGRRNVRPAPCSLAHPQTCQAVPARFGRAVNRVRPFSTPSRNRAACRYARFAIGQSIVHTSTPRADRATHRCHHRCHEELQPARARPYPAGSVCLLEAFANKCSNTCAARARSCCLAASVRGWTFNDQPRMTGCTCCACPSVVT